MSDVNLNELKAIVNFIYLGQTNVEQENLQRFLKIAAKFQVRGLTDNEPSENKTETNSQQKLKTSRKSSSTNKSKTSSPFKTPVDLNDDSLVAG